MKLSLTKKKILTVIMIDTNWLKLVQLSLLPKENKITKIIARKITSLADDAIINLVTVIAKELRIHTSGLFLCVPHKLTVIKIFELPLIEPGEIKDMVELQIGKQTPFTRDEIIYDYEIIDTTPEGYSKIMLVIIHKDIISRYFKILESSGLKTENIHLSSEGLLGWLYLTSKESIGDKPYILIDVDYDTSDFEVVLKDKLIFSRSIPLGLVNFANAQDWQGRFIEEINYSIYAYQNEMMDRDISKITITGIERLMGGLDKNLLENKLGIPLEIRHQFIDIPMDKEILDSKDTTIQNNSVVSLIGLAFAQDRLKINLIPQELRIEKGVREKGKDAFILGILIIFIFVTVTSIFWAKLYNKERYLHLLKKEVSGVKDRADKLEDMLKEIDIVNRRVQTKNYAINFLYEVHSIISPEIYLMSISFEGKTRLIL